MALYNPAQITVNVPTSSTPTSSSTTSNNVNSSTTSQSILAINSNRKGATIFNASTANLFLDFDGAVTTSDYAVKITAGGYYELPFDYTGVIFGIWDAANGSALVREFI